MMSKFPGKIFFITSFKNPTNSFEINIFNRMIEAKVHDQFESMQD